MAPLFSEGLALESIELKRMSTETYMVDVPDYGVCTREISEVLGGGCTGIIAENGSCISEEEYECVTGYHQEERTRDVVSYEPVTDGSYEKDKGNKNNKEKDVEKHREKLPDKLKQLKNVGHSKEFDLDGEVTIRMCFRAPEEGSETISYLTYSENDEDYESSSAVDIYDYYMPIDCSNMDDGVPFVINGADGFDLGCGKQTVWTYCSGTGTALYYNGCDDYAVWNDAGQLPMEVELGSGADYENANVWLDFNLRYAMTEADATDSSPQGVDATKVGDPQVVAGKIGNALDFDNDAVTFNGLADIGLVDFTHEFWMYNDNAYSVWGQTLSLYKIRRMVCGPNIQLAGYPGCANCFSCGVKDTGGWKGVSIPAADLTASTWHHVAFVSDAGTDISIYLNGVPKQTITVGAIEAYTNRNNVLAADDLAAGGFFNGKLDEVRFWSRALTGAEIAASYNNIMGTAGYGDLGDPLPTGGSTTTLDTTTTIPQQGGGAEAVVESDIDGNLILSPAGTGKVKVASLADSAGTVYSIKDISDWQGQCSVCVGVNDINQDEVQKRIQNSCTGDNAIRQINADGSTDCVPVGSGGTGSCSDCDGTFVNVVEDTMTGNLILDKDSGDSPHLQFKDGGDDYLQIYKKDGSTGLIETIGTGKIALKPADNGNGIWFTNSAGDAFLKFKQSEVYPLPNATVNLGRSDAMWNEIWGAVNHIGDIREPYDHNPDYEYEVGTVVAFDPDSEHEIKPIEDALDRIIGVVAELPHYETTTECMDVEETDCQEKTYYVDMDIAIYGKFHTVKVKGKVKAGDYLVSSDEEGVATSLYDKEHPFNKNAFKKSTKKKEYNFNAKMFPTLGIAMEDHDSDDVGTIKVVLGK